MRIRYTVLVSMLTLLAAVPAQAGYYRIDFSGELSHTPSGAPLAVPVMFNGYIIAGDLTNNVSTNDNVGNYLGVPATGQVQVGNTNYTLSPGFIDLVSVADNSGDQFDLFGMGYDYIDVNGNSIFFALQLSSGTDWFEGIEYPDAFDLNQLDPFDPLNFNTTAAVYNGPGNNDLYVGSFNSINFRPVPIPGALWLFGSALVIARFSRNPLSMNS